MRKASIVLWKPASELRAAKAVLLCQCLWAVPGRHLKGDIPTWEFPSLERAGLLLRGGSDRTSFSACVQLAVPVPGGSGPRGQLSTTRVLNGGPGGCRPALPPGSPFPLACVQARHLPLPALRALASFGDRGLSRPPGFHVSWMKPQQCPSPRGGPERFPDWVSRHLGTGAQPSMGDGPEAPGHLPWARPITSYFSDLLAIKQLGETDTDRISTLTFQRRKPRHRVAFGLACKPHSQARGHCGRAGCSPLRPPPPPRGSNLPGEQGAGGPGIGAVPSPPLGGAFCSCWA